MSVNGINAAEPQQKSHNMTAAIGTGTVLGAAGAIAGHQFGGSKPSLEKVFAMEPDTFTTATKDAEGEAKTAADTIKAEIDNLNSDASYKTDAAKAKVFDAEVGKQKLEADHEAVKAEATAKEAYDAKVLEKANEGKEEAAKYKKLEDVSKEDLKTAKAALKDSDEAKTLTDAKAKVKEAKVEAFRNAAKAEGADPKLAEIVKNYDEAVKEAATKKSNKIAELAGKEDMKSAFDKIKKMFPKEGKGKAAAMYGAAAAAVGLIAGYLLSGKSAPVEQPEQQA